MHCSWERNLWGKLTSLVSRGPSAVLFHRMNRGVVGPTGVYTYEVPDENHVVQQLYIGVGLGIQ